MKYLIGFTTGVLVGSALTVGLATYEILHNMGRLDRAIGNFTRILDEEFDDLDEADEDEVEYEEDMDDEESYCSCGEQFSVTESGAIYCERCDRK